MQQVPTEYLLPDYTAPHPIHFMHSMQRKQHKIGSNKKGKVVPVQDVWGSGCIDPHFLDLGTSWR
jgi:hypothetical protein